MIIDAAAQQRLKAIEDARETLAEYLRELKIQLFPRQTHGSLTQTEEKDESDFLDRMDLWNCEGGDDSYPCVKMGDINRMLKIIRRLKNEVQI